MASELGSGYTNIRKVFDQVDLKSKITESYVINDDASELPRNESGVTDNLQKKQDEWALQRPDTAAQRKQFEELVGQTRQMWNDMKEMKDEHKPEIA